MQEREPKIGNSQRPKVSADELAVKIDEALKSHQAGKLQKAKKLYQKVLKIDPGCNDALHMLGLIAHQSGNNDMAMRLYKKAIANNRNSPELCTNFGNALQAAGQMEEAITAFGDAIVINPNFALAHNNLGNALSIIGKKNEAMASLRKAIALIPNYAQAYFNLGNLLYETGKLDEAISSFRQAIAIEPVFTKAMNNLAKLLMDKGDNAEAASLFERVLELDKNNGMAQHLLAALQGRTTTTAPESYVAGLFNGAAGSFDRHLVEVLEYKVPQYLKTAVSTALDEDNNSLDFLDLGCGTGLCGPLFRPQAKKLVGVDLAPGMLEQAAELGVYDRLITGDISSVLRKSKSAYDVVLAADVFIYVGELEQVFEAIERALKPGGLFAFSVESGNDGDGYSLLATGRYAHSVSYIKTVAAATGLREVNMDAKVLRIDRDIPINGHIFVLKREWAG
ncbi:tetratricopeptide repeat protein [Pseudomonadota bacterium]